MPRKVGGRKRGKYLMISAVAEHFDIHPQTLRMYEREGLLTPHRSAGNTRLYDENAMRRIETILTLTRDMGVNLAGVEVILGMRQEMERMQIEVDRLLDVVQQEIRDRRAGIERRHALVHVESRALSRVEE